MKYHGFSLHFSTILNEYYGPFKYKHTLLAVNEFSLQR